MPFMALMIDDIDGYGGLCACALNSGNGTKLAQTFHVATLLCFHV
jgi:hypothetical protein